MTLNPQPTYPSHASYVLKLHRDGLAQAGPLRGRIEHIASGDSFEFADGEGLLAGLARHAATLRAAAGGAPPPAASLVTSPLPSPRHET